MLAFDGGDEDDGGDAYESDIRREFLFMPKTFLKEPSPLSSSSRDYFSSRAT